ncbi:MAG: site-specific DNA-methyltransferase [Pseudomonadota bacterium]
MQPSPWPAQAIEMRPRTSLRAFAQNSRTHSPAQVQQLVRSIEQWGWTVPILIDPTGEVIAGHGRLAAAEFMGIEDVPCMVAEGWTEAQKRAYVIADNRLAENAGWDEAMLSAELAFLSGADFGVELLGFSDQDLARLLVEDRGGLTEPDAVPDLPKVHVSAPGDVWILGPHRLLCGDSTSMPAVRAMMGDTLADAMWTDPPYNVDYQGSAGAIKNDAMSDKAFRLFLHQAFATALEVMKPGAAAYVAHADTEGLNFRGAFADVGFKLSGCLIWTKDSLVLGRSDYQWQHEPILYGWKPGAAHRWFGGRKKTTVLADTGSVFTVNEDGTMSVRVGSAVIVITGENLQATAVDSTLIRCEKPKRSAEHPTMKPVELIRRMLNNSTRPGDVVLDLFGGSGSTLIACETMGLQARLVELDERFADVIVKRWQDFTGLAATLEADGRSFAEVSAERVPA